VFEAMFYHLLEQAQSQAALKRRKFRFKNPLVLAGRRCCLKFCEKSSKAGNFATASILIDIS